MSLHDAFVWLGETGVGKYLAASTPVFAAIQSLHILFFSVLGGAFLITNLSAIGILFRGTDTLTLARRIFPVLLIALAGAAITGVLLVSAGPLKYFSNALFPWKLAVLAAALFVQLAIYPGLVVFRDGAGAAIARPLGAALGGFSLLLWLGVAILGRWIGLI